MELSHNPVGCEDLGCTRAGFERFPHQVLPPHLFEGAAKCFLCRRGGHDTDPIDVPEHDIPRLHALVSLISSFYPRRGKYRRRRV